MNVSLDPAENVTSPDAFEVPAKERLIIIEVSDTPELFSVSRVLMPFFCNLRRRIFLFWSVIVTRFRVAPTEVMPLLRVADIDIVFAFVTAVTFLSSNAPAAPEGNATIYPTRSSFVKSVWKPLIVVPEPVYVTSPVRVRFELRIAFAVKSASPVSGSSIAICLTASNACLTTALIVMSTLLLFSSISSASVEEVELSFSPGVNVPTTEPSEILVELDAEVT